MNTRLLLTGSLAALMLGGTMVGCTAGGGKGIASASATDAGINAKGAADNAARATKALAKRDGDGAVRFAEGAVAMAPREAGYRVLLGQSYLQAGRFASAGTAYADALSLDPANGKAALNLALAQVATGNFAAARATLAHNEATIPASDRGLALALAGDPVNAVGLLMQVARSPQTSPKVRQNLGLALALAGQWSSARVVASTDMSPADVDRRMAEWAAFAQPQAASDQVASLLGVRATTDGGQPVALALNAPVAVAPVAVTEATPVAAAPVVVQPAPMQAPLEAPVKAAGVTFAPSRAVVQPIPATLIRPESGVTKVALVGGKAVAVRAPRLAPTAAAAAGPWVVQIGAFESAAVARDAWGRAVRRLPALAQRGPSGMNYVVKNARFYRLSVGGFARADADTLCRRYRARGGVCFVRSNAGDQIAQWLKKGGVQLASR